MRAEPRQARLCQAEPSQAVPSRAEPSQARPNRAWPGQAGPSHARWRAVPSWPSRSRLAGAGTAWRGAALGLFWLSAAQHSRSAGFGFSGFQSPQLDETLSKQNTCTRRSRTPKRTTLSSAIDLLHIQDQRNKLTLPKRLQTAADKPEAFVDFSNISNTI